MHQLVSRTAAEVGKPKSQDCVVRSISIADDSIIEWRIPTHAEIMAQSSATWGKQYDRIERKTVQGGLPIIIERIGVA